jgi:hypothetical protein
MHRGAVTDDKASAPLQDIPLSEHLSQKTGYHRSRRTDHQTKILVTELRDYHRAFLFFDAAFFR